MTLDAAVVGGGPAGAVAALILARADKRVALVEARAEGRERPRPAESLPPAGRRLLADLGLDDGLDGLDPLPCPGTVSVWGSDTPGGLDFLRAPEGPGWHLDRGRFDRLLRSAARDAGAELVAGARVGRVARTADGGFRLAGSAGELACRTLVDATGRAGAIARRLGARRVTEDRLVAEAARLRGDPADRDARTWVEAVDDGWWYSLLVAPGERWVGRVGDPEPGGARDGRDGRDGRWDARLARAGRLAAWLADHGYRRTGPVLATAAGSARLMSVAGAGWVAVGDASIAFDPLSSQGLLHALWSGLAAGRALAAPEAERAAELAAYAARLEEIWQIYRERRAAFYALERRFGDRPFWRRRQGSD